MIGMYSSFSCSPSVRLERAFDVERDGKRTHIFNPSAFGQSLFAIVLIATGTTHDLTVGRDIAASFDTPHMLLVIFFGGLVVQYLFQVTLMTASAAMTLVLLNLVYTQITDVYLFVSINVAAPIFLGMHLLLTDPATSPRSNIGKVMFGVLYAISYTVLFRVFDLMEIPLFLGQAAARADPQPLCSAD